MIIIRYHRYVQDSVLFVSQASYFLGMTYENYVAEKSGYARIIR